jgi:Uma2 family endonuclease
MEIDPLVLRFPPALDMTDDQFFGFCQLNDDLRLERTAEGDIVIMPPTGAETSNTNSDITMQLGVWAKKHGKGVVFDSSCGFRLPNGATRSPDAAWVSRPRLTEFSAEEKKKFLPLCPNFVIELRSPSDRLSDLKTKMEEYRENGALLGWLIDPIERQVHLYRPGRSAEQLDKPGSISADPELPGFVLDLAEIWEPTF